MSFNSRPIVLNFIGGPGVGKSTMAAGVFARLKRSSVECELIGEYAKDKTWEESLKVLEDQVYVLGKQHHRMYCLKDKVDVIITDSPLFLSLVYGWHLGKNFSKLTLELFNNYNNITYVLKRTTHYNSKGRNEDLDRAKRIDYQVKEILDRHHIQYQDIEPGLTAEDDIVKEVLLLL